MAFLITFCLRSISEWVLANIHFKCECILFLCFWLSVVITFKIKFNQIIFVFLLTVYSKWEFRYRKVFCDDLLSTDFRRIGNYFLGSNANKHNSCFLNKICLKNNKWYTFFLVQYTLIFLESKHNKKLLTGICKID